MTDTDDDPGSPGEKHCDLCEAARFTHWYHECEVCWIADCEVCSVPMAVWKPHGTDPSPDDVAHMHAELGRVGDERFGPDGWFIDTVMRQIPEHYHAHCRDPEWHRFRWSRALSRYTGVGTERIER